jgi:alpha-ketoglutarate-dependent taurine dioxygenase
MFQSATRDETAIPVVGPDGLVALDHLVAHGHPAGALLIKGLPVGELGVTPASPTAPTTKDGTSEATLLGIARRLGEPVGYLPEHGGDLVQNLVPTQAEAARQTSTSSRVRLDWHTETAFHPHKPRYLVLLCLRGDPAAQTLLCSMAQLDAGLPERTRLVLREARFRIGVDESFTDGRTVLLPELRPVVSGPAPRPEFTFDAGLMVGADAEADEALAEVRRRIELEHVAVTLEAGDLLVVDNHVAVHGRSPFPARFDGTDRWLQRTFVVEDLAPSAGERAGHVITTHFT